MWLPTDSVAVLKVAVPPDSVPLPILVEPSWKVTVPLGVPAPGLTAATVAVKVTLWPKTDGFGVELASHGGGPVNLNILYALMWAWFCGCGFIQVGYDTDLRNGRGDTTAYWRDPETVFPDPYSVDDKKWQYVILEDHMWLDVIKQYWPVPAQRVTLNRSPEPLPLSSMGRRGVVLPVVGPRGCAVVAQSVGYEAMVRSNPLALRLPISKIHPGPMDKDDWRTNAIIDVGQVYAVHPHFRHSPLRSLRSGAVWPRCTKH